MTQQTQKEKLEVFAEVLNSLSSLSDKKRLLWMHIYENALEDRENANGLLVNLRQEVEKSPAEHHLHGPILTKYIERMTRANDQILKLAELIQKAEEMTIADVPIERDDIYAQIGKR